MGVDLDLLPEPDYSRHLSSNPISVNSQSHTDVLERERVMSKHLKTSEFNDFFFLGGEVYQSLMRRNGGGGGLLAMTSVSTAFQRATASAPPACRRRRRSTPTTSTSLSTAPKSTATWCSSSPGSKGEARKKPVQGAGFADSMRWKPGSDPVCFWYFYAEWKICLKFFFLKPMTHHYLETNFLSLECRPTYWYVDGSDGQKVTIPSSCSRI